MNNKNKGIIYIIIAALSFALMSLFIQLADEAMFIQKVFFRNIVALICAVIVMRKQKISFNYKKENLKYLVLRGTFGTLGIFLNFYAIENLILSDATMIAKLSPFFVVIFSFFILKEKIKYWQATSIMIAFIGCIFIVNPNIFETGIISGFDNVAAIVGVFGAMSAGVAYTMIRLLTIKGEKGPFIVFFFSAFSTIVTLPILLLTFEPIAIDQLLIMIGSGIFASCGQFAITAAYANAPAKDISIYDYTQAIFSAILGFIVFGQLPTYTSVIGYLIIILVAIYMYTKRDSK